MQLRQMPETEHITGRKMKENMEETVDEKTVDMERAEESVPMDDHSIEASIEAILFAMGTSVEADRIAQALGITREQLQVHLDRLMASYEAENRGICMIRLEDSYQLCTRKEYYETLIRIAKVPRRIKLTDVLLETLAIIAYKQPVTKLEIEKIRGVQSDHAVNRLVEYELVEEVGRLDAPGRPILFGTTENFLRHFGVSSLEELPVVDPLAKEDFKLEAEKEVDEKLKMGPSSRKKESDGKKPPETVGV